MRWSRELSKRHNFRDRRVRYRKFVTFRSQIGSVKSILKPCMQKGEYDGGLSVARYITHVA